MGCVWNREEPGRVQRLLTGSPGLRHPVEVADGDASGRRARRNGSTAPLEPVEPRDAKRAILPRHAPLHSCPVGSYLSGGCRT